MSYVPAKYTYSTPVREHHDFELTDEKGRYVGGVIIKRTITIEPREVPTKGHDWGSVAEPDYLGTWFTVTHQSTRNGKDFGASAKEMKFRTEHERDAHAVKASHRARLVAIRKHGKR